MMETLFTRMVGLIRVTYFPGARADPGGAGGAPMGVMETLFTRLVGL